FSIDDVIQILTKKMIHRHPHVFAKGNPEKSWDELKQEEKKENADSFLLDDVIMSAPALQVAYELQRKAQKVGFDWEKVDDIWEKFDEEHEEFAEAVISDDQVHMEEEFGDILFVLAN